MPVRLGISPIGWSNDDLPELGGDTPLETCLAEARLAGFEGIELGNKFPRDPAVLRPILERQGLSLISGWCSGRLLARSVTEELAAIEAHRALLVAMGCAVLVYAETSGSIAADRCRPLFCQDTCRRRAGFGSPPTKITRKRSTISPSFIITAEAHRTTGRLRAGSNRPSTTGPGTCRHRLAPSKLRRASESSQRQPANTTNVVEARCRLDDPPDPVRRGEISPSSLARGTP